MNYIPHSDADRTAMLRAIGVANVEELFHDVPEAYRYPPLNLPAPVSEFEILQELQTLSEENVDLNHATCFLGAGAYRHFIPSVVDFVISRSEFYTAYTPYQPEISQGTLQAMFEYQTMICALTGMEVSNASHYDGATSTAEAVIMALNVHRGQRRKVILSPAVHPQYRQVVRTYTQGMGLTLVGDEGISNGPEELMHLCDEQTACVVIQVPDFFGRVLHPDRLRALAQQAHGCGALLVVVANPIALGLLQPPGAWGADIVVGEGQALGNPLNFGGPYLGFFACRMEHVRRSSGRIVGETVDLNGQRGYVLTLNTREQHIRRAKATSNICTNQSLNALAAAVYLSALGRQGLRRVAELCYHKAHYAADQIAALPGYALWSGDFFHEFVVRCPKPVAAINRYLLDEWGIIGGYDLGQDYPELAGHMLLCVTEVNSRQEIDDLATALREVAEQEGEL
ncbi:MAG: aminomethyl-transferring glycine dehydrogenase subunit GcvPA [Anaerolineae bacterium]|nr:aminomethyl-transferring glycine dehydrogenase subunit GcvPA [Anaerolineae bacterium]MDW8099467.1 aminomethyl-transferring glycine dehydrogenase subunit GcvPA [Anaerolineae bacterium]